MRRILFALLLLPALAFGQAFNVCGSGGVALATAIRTATTVNSADFRQSGCNGGHFVINIGTATAGTYTFHIQGKDPASGAYYDILVSSALGSTGTTVLRVHPNLTTSTNLIANDLLPPVFRVQAAGAASQNMTFSVGFGLVP